MVWFTGQLANFYIALLHVNIYICVYSYAVTYFVFSVIVGLYSNCITLVDLVAHN